MKIRSFPQANVELKPQTGSPVQLQTIKVFNDNEQTIICYELTAEEVQQIIEGRCIYAAFYSGTIPPPPTMLFTKSPFAKHKEAFCDLFYICDSNPQKGVWIWNGGDFAPLPVVMIENLSYTRAPVNSFTKPNPEKPLEVGMLYFRLPTKQEADDRKAKMMDYLHKLPNLSAETLEDMKLKYRENGDKLPVLVEVEQAGKEFVHF